MGGARGLEGLEDERDWKMIRAGGWEGLEERRF